MAQSDSLHHFYSQLTALQTLPSRPHHRVDLAEVGSSGTGRAVPPPAHRPRTRPRQRTNHQRGPAAGTETLSLLFDRLLSLGVGRSNPQPARTSTSLLPTGGRRAMMSTSGPRALCGQQMIPPRAGRRPRSDVWVCRAWGVLLKAADEWSQPGSPDTDRVGPRLGTHRDRPTQPRMIERLVGRQPRMIKRLVGRQPRMIKRLVLPGSDNCPCRRMGWCSLMAALLKGSSRSWLSKLQTSAPRMLTEVVD